MNYEEFLKLVKTRRSIRRYETTSVPMDLIQKILEAARWAPSGANSQPWEFVVIRNKEIKNEICHIIKQNLPQKELGDEELKPPEGFKEAPVFIIVCGDTRRKILLPGSCFELENEKISTVKNPDLNIEEIFNSSLSNAMLYIQLAAKTLGLGSQWITATNHPKVQSKIKKLLRIPEYMEIYDTVAIGYPAVKPKPRFVRKLGEIVHYNAYDKTKSKPDRWLIESLNDLMKNARSHLEETSPK